MTLLDNWVNMLLISGHQNTRGGGTLWNGDVVCGGSGDTGQGEYSQKLLIQIEAT